MNKKEFHKHVKHEIEQLLIYATKEERDKLDFNSLHPRNPCLCIYGLMTGSCNTARSKELRKFCCNVFFGGIKGINSDCYYYSKRNITKESFTGFSPLEVYITLDQNNNEDVIKVLREEMSIDKLEL